MDDQESDYRMPLKVYCEPGAWCEGLKQLQNENRIEVVQFPYEQKSRRSGLASPSDATWDELNLTWDEADFAFNEAERSEKYEEIQALVGVENRRDVKHIDSAFKTGCQCFFTRDKGDILSRADDLEELLGIRFFHPDEDWGEFLVFLGPLSSEDEPNGS